MKLTVRFIDGCLFQSLIFGKLKSYLTYDTEVKSRISPTS